MVSHAHVRVFVLTDSHARALEAMIRSDPDAARTVTGSAAGRLAAWCRSDHTDNRYLRQAGGLSLTVCA